MHQIKNRFFSKSLLLIATTILLSSCYTGRMIEFEVLVPAENTTPDSASSIAVANHTQKLQKAHYFRYSDKLLKDTTKIDTLLPQAFITGVKSVLFDSPTLFLIEDSINIPITKEMPANLPLSKSMQKQLRNTYETDLLIVLESIEAFDAIDFYYTDYEMLGEFQLILKSYTRMYDLRTGRIFLRKSLADTLFWSAQGYDANEILQQLPARAQAYDDAAYESGRGLAKMISPYWLNVRRGFYTSGNKEFLAAEKAMDQGNWETASEKWTLLSSEKNKNIASKACFNMALAAEYNGKLEEAKNWLEKSIQIKVNEAAKQYLLIINERIKNTAKLQYQIDRSIGE